VWLDPEAILCHKDAFSCAAFSGRLFPEVTRGLSLWCHKHSGPSLGGEGSPTMMLDEKLLGDSFSGYEELGLTPEPWL
jgi:hypothetical protein